MLLYNFWNNKLIVFVCLRVCTRTQRVSPCTNCSGPSSTRLRRGPWTPEWRKPSTPSTTRGCWATMSSTLCWWGALALKLPSRASRASKSPHGFKTAWQTLSAVTVVTARNPHRRLAAFVQHPFSVLVFRAPERYRRHIPAWAGNKRGFSLRSLPSDLSVRSGTKRQHGYFLLKQAKIKAPRVMDNYQTGLNYASPATRDGACDRIIKAKKWVSQAVGVFPVRYPPSVALIKADRTWFCGQIASPRT